MTERTVPGLRLVVLALLVFAAAAWRWLPYLAPGTLLWNFAPIAAISLFAGVKIRNRWVALLVPLAAMAVSDLVLHLNGWAPLTNAQEFTQQAIHYIFYVSVVLLGWSVRRIEHPAAVIGATLLGSIGFFLVSNFVFWLLADASLPPAYQYPPTLEGLLQCYTMALPFFKGTLLGDLVFSTVLFGGFALAERLLPALREPRWAAA